MAKINITPEVKKFFNFINSNESLATELSTTKNCTDVPYTDDTLDLLAVKYAEREKEMEKLRLA